MELVQNTLYAYKRYNGEQCMARQNALYEMKVEKKWKIRNKTLYEAYTFLYLFRLQFKAVAYTQIYNEMKFGNNLQNK